MTNETADAVVLHAPTKKALKRARNNAINLQRDRPQTRIEIVVNADGVRAALSERHPADDLLVFCRNTLSNTGQTADAGATVVANAILHIVERQRKGWAYVRS